MKALSLDDFCQQTTERYIKTYMHSIGLEYVYYTQNHYRDNVLTYTEYLNQPFTPELIVEKFKGWERESNIYFEDTKNLHSISMYYRNQFHIYSNTLKYAINFPIPKTLEDFIKFCSYAEIELEFKEPQG